MMSVLFLLLVALPVLLHAWNLRRDHDPLEVEPSFTSSYYYYNGSSNPFSYFYSAWVPSVEISLADPSSKLGPTSQLPNNQKYSKVTRHLRVNENSYYSYAYSYADPGAASSAYSYSYAAGNSSYYYYYYSAPGAPAVLDSNQIQQSHPTLFNVLFTAVDNLLQSVTAIGQNPREAQEYSNCIIPTDSCNPNHYTCTLMEVAEYNPVCGCDGKTYDNACVARYNFCNSCWTSGPCPE